MSRARIFHGLTSERARGSRRQLGPGAPVTCGIRFRCSDEQAAVLVLKRGAHREEVPPGRTLASYIVRNHASWHRFAIDVVQLDIREEDVIFGGDFGPSMKAGFSVGMTRHVSMSVEWRSGPPCADVKDAELGEAPLFDQAVFLLYYKFKRRAFRAPKALRGAADPKDPCWSEDGRQDGDSLGTWVSDAGSESVVLESFPAEHKVLAYHVPFLSCCTSPDPPRSLSIAIPWTTYWTTSSRYGEGLSYDLNSAHRNAQTSQATCAIVSDQDLLSVFPVSDSYNDFLNS